MSEAIRHAIVEGGLVTNVILAPPGFEGGVECGPEVGIGWSYAGGQFEAPAAPPEPEPSTNPVDYPLKRWEFRAMVSFLDVGASIEAAIQSIPDPLQRAVALARYKDSDVYVRDDPLFETLAPAVGLTPQQVDEAWMTIVNNRTS